MLNPYTNSPKTNYKILSLPALDKVRIFIQFPFSKPKPKPKNSKQKNTNTERAKTKPQSPEDLRRGNLHRQYLRRRVRPRRRRRRQRARPWRRSERVSTWRASERPGWRRARREGIWRCECEGGFWERKLRVWRYSWLLETEEPFFWQNYYLQSPNKKKLACYSILYGWVLLDKEGRVIGSQIRLGPSRDPHHFSPPIIGLMGCYSLPKVGPLRFTTLKEKRH